jgi:hypothetical protein
MTPNGRLGSKDFLVNLHFFFHNCGRLFNCNFLFYNWGRLDVYFFGMVMGVMITLFNNKLGKTGYTENTIDEEEYV